jgi:hypothetical protein
MKMPKYKWIENLTIKEYLMPFVIEKDADYMDALKCRLKFICEDMKKAGAEQRFVIQGQEVCDKLVNALDTYYKGNIWEAHMILDDIIHKIEHKSPAVASINETYQLWGNGSDVQLFRARLGESMICYPAEEMLHIPFNLRSRVRTERFSIPGLPCLYLGNTSYSCWIEMGAPDDCKFNVSPIIIEKDMYVLNLAVSIRHIIMWNEKEDMEEDMDNELETWLTLLFLTIATSFTVKEEGRDFKSEYVIPQMIMSACIDHDLDGVVYISKKVSEEVFGMVVAVNVALFAKYEGENRFSKICKDIKTADSFNFAMYNRILLNSQKCKDIELTTQSSPFIKNIGSYNRQIPYRETTFYGFDKYLFTSVEMKKIE